MNYYETLGVPENASIDEIKKAFREKAKTTHPDTNRADTTLEEKFKKISEAYDTLSDPNKKQQYDHTLKYGDQGANPFNMFGNGGAFDAFSQMFNFRFREAEEKQKVQHISIRFNIPLVEAFKGFEQEIEINRNILCKECKGTGEAEDCKTQTCTTCGGTGMHEIHQRTQLGVFTTRSTCPSCAGAGKTKTNLCKKCNGSGKENQKEKIKVTIPKGLHSGNKIILRGKGHQISEKEFSDLFIVINLIEHEFFKTNGNDILIEMPIPVHSVLCGEEIEVPTLHGIEKIKINENHLKNGSFVIKDKGYPKKNETHNFGNQHVYFKFEFPKSVPDELKEQLKKIDINLYSEYQKTNETYRI